MAPLKAKINSEGSTYPPSLEGNASFISKMLFLWTNKVITNAQKPNLKESDLIDLTEYDRLRYILDQVKTQEKKYPKRGLTFHIFMTGIPDFVRSTLASIIVAGLTFAGPIFLSKIISNIANPESEKSVGYIYASVLFGCFFIKAFISQHATHITNKITYKMANQMMGLMYEKLLRLSNSAKKYMDPGKMTNLVIMNTLEVINFFLFAFMSLSAPLIIVGASAYIIYELGAIGLIAPGMLTLSSFFVYYIQSKQVNMRRSVFVIIDQRCKQITEFFQGIKIIKYYAWEDWVLKTLEKIRSKEIKIIFDFLFNIGQVECVSNIAPSLIAVVVFIIYIANGSSLNASTAFTVLSLINMLQSPIIQMISGWGKYYQTKISYARILHFLSAEEKAVNYYDQELSERLKLGEIQVIDGNFSWESTENENHNLLNPDKLLVNQASRDKLSAEIKEKELKGEDTSKLVAQLQEISAKPISEQWGVSTLSEINLRLSPGTFNGIYGVFSSGKTTLVHALINELHKNSGRIAVNGSIAYIPQTPWLRSCSLRDNITFGESFDSKRYKKVIKICELTDDIAQLAGGDLTEIGELGVNLSGGQKQRISIARAVYSNRDIMIVDDCLSALDSHVGKQIFNTVFMKYLKGKTIVFITHHMHLMDKFDTVTIVQSGKIADHGTYSDLVTKESPALAFLRDHVPQAKEPGAQATNDIEEPEEIVKQSDDADVQNKSARKIRGISMNLSQKSRKQSGCDNLEQEEVSEDNDEGIDNNKKDKEKQQKGALIENEEKAVGSVPLKVYHQYFQIGGYSYIFLALMVFSVAQTTLMMSDWWLGQWSSVAYSNLDNKQYAGIYAGLSLSGGLLYLLRYLSFLLFSMQVSRNIFKSLLVRLLHSPMSFFDTTPLGRIVSRFSKDLDSIDYYLQMVVQQLVGGLMNVIGSFVMISLITPIFLAVCAVLVVIYYFVLRYELRSSREIKRIVDLIRAPLIGVYTELNQGLIQIRSLSKEKFFFSTFEKCVDAHTRSTFNTLFCDRWRGLITDVFSSFIIAASAYLGLAQKESGSSDYHLAALIGLSVSWALKISYSLPTTVTWIAETELQMNSVHRILNYIQETPQERPFILPTQHHKSSTSDAKQSFVQWPANASIEISNVQYKYREDTPIILKGISLSIAAKQKIGVIGRTGSGKSTLTLGLLRILELVDEEKGSIVLDSRKISSLGLKELRSNISMIPQDPVLFQGTIRSNVDPFESYSDAQVIDALMKVQLWKPLLQRAKDLNKNTASTNNNLTNTQGQVGITTSLNTNENQLNEASPIKPSNQDSNDDVDKSVLDLTVDTGGGNFSQGEKQLIALSRVIVRNCKLLLMDEATASIDEKTDWVIQNMIRTHFQDTTIITIAHRLKTIIQYDKILVLADGEIKEFDSPKTMLSNENSYLLKLVREQGKESEEEMKRLAFAST